MEQFSIDDNRESFTADVETFLARIDAAVKRVAAAPEKAALQSLAAEDGTPVFECIEQCSHTIYGTSSLIRVGSLSKSAMMMSLLAQYAQSCASSDRVQARTLSTFFGECEGAMRRMLEFELAGESDAAWSVAVELRESAARWSSYIDAAYEDAPGIPVEAEAEEFGFGEPQTSATFAPSETALKEHGDDAAFAFDSFVTDAPPLATASSLAEAVADVGPTIEVVDPVLASTPGLAEELLEIFQQEALQSLTVLEANLLALASNSNDGQAARSLERTYHTLKGSAATVGLMPISRAAAELEDSVEAVIEKPGAFTSEFLMKIVAMSNKMLVASGLPELTLSVDAAGKVPLHSDALDTIFFEEADRILRQLEAYSNVHLPDPSPDQTEQMRTDAAKLLHRLKGSASVYGNMELAGEATRLQGLFESTLETAEVHPELKAGVAALSRILKRKPDPRVVAGETGRETSAADSVVLSPDALPVRTEVQPESDPELRQVFETECGELLLSVDKMLFTLEESEQPQKVLQELSRLYHTLKGTVNTVGLSPIGAVIHRVEDYIGELSNATILPPMRRVTSILLKVQDGIRLNLKQAPKGYVETNLALLEYDIEQVRSGAMMPPSHAAISGLGSRGSSAAQPGSSVKSASGVGVDESKADSDLSGFELSERKSIRVSTDRLDALMNLAGELVVSRARLLRRVQALNVMQRELSGSKRRLLETVEGFRDQHEFNLRSATRTGLIGTSGRKKDGAKTKKPGTVNSPLGGNQVFSELELDSYDDVNILARTLNEIGSDVSEVQHQINGALQAFGEDCEEFSAIITGLQGEITRARMVPVDQLFGRLRRPVRDASEREVKNVRVATAGETVDLDKKIIDELYVPMLHLVRNCAAHGIESPEARVAAGKDPSGVVMLAARQESGQIVIEVSDDGAGLDRTALREQGLRMGLISPDLPLNSPEIDDLVFVSGLSTRKTIGAVSGRGVGCDVVRREIERLNGRVNVRTTPGKGTSFIITLPLTLAICRALQIEHAGQMYAIPVNFAARSVDLAATELVESAGVTRINIAGTYLPLQDLDKILGLPPRKAAPGGAAILLALGDRSVAIKVDRVLGQDEIVVKSLGDVLRGHPLFSGVTISGDGTLILIIDVPGLLDSVNQGQAATARSVTAEALPAELQQGEREAPAPRAEEPKHAAPPAAGRQLKVLFVDDSLSVRKVAEKFLKNLGVQLTLAIDGQDGMEKLRESAFDLVFTDLEMPRKHGYELIRELRFVPAYKDIPVIVITSRSSEKHRLQAEMAGASDYVTKPFTQDILQQKLREWAGSKPGEGRLNKSEAKSQ